LNQSRQLRAHYTYDSWGNTISITDRVAGGREITDSTNIGILNQIRYRGYYLDTETGYYYLMSRYYNPEVGRFLNADGYLMASNTVLSTNMYSYCENNPIIYMDYDGIYPKLSEVPPPSTGYTPPKGGPIKEKVPKGSYQGQWGWKDSKGRYWVPDKSDHGGEHWDVVSKNGKSHKNVYRDGYTRGDDDNNGSSGGSSVFSNNSFANLFTPSDESQMIVVQLLLIVILMPLIMFVPFAVLAFA